MRSAGTSAPVLPPGFVHEAFGYRGDDDFLDGVLPFVREGLARGETVVVAEPRPRLDQLRHALDGDAAAVEFLDMTEIGGNPGRIIAVWAAALDRAGRAGRGLRGVGEPAYPGRSPAEFGECEVHELLLDLAFADGPAWRLMCPYDRDHLPPASCRRALAGHPFRTTPAGPVPTTRPAEVTVASAFAATLPPPSGPVLRGAFRVGDVPTVRRTVLQWVRSCGLPTETADALQLAATELATNSIRHGGGTGTLAMWVEPGAAVLEVTDAGHIEDPLVGRLPPSLEQEGGRGVYLVHQLCDLVQIRSSPGGTTVRITSWL